MVISALIAFSWQNDPTPYHPSNIFSAPFFNEKSSMNCYGFQYRFEYKINIKSFMLMKSKIPFLTKHFL